MPELHVDEALRALATALALGLLVGLQRERAAAAVAGIRTFALVTWLGCAVALLGRSVGAWLLGAGLLGVVALAGLGHAAKVRRADDVGITTEVALLLMYAVGALVVLGDVRIAIVLTGGTALLLHWKGPLHEFVQRIGEADLAAVMRFVLIALVVLPALPDQPLGPYGALNPFDIWRMVVLIVGIGLAGYVAYKLAGPRFGPLLGGAVGGLVSSTATAASYARRASAQPDHARLCARVIAVASAVVFARIGVEVAAASPGVLAALALPLALVFGAALLGAALLWRGEPGLDAQGPDLGNPAGLAPALAFAGIYAAVLLATAYVRERFGDLALYGVAGLAGLTDVDAIALSMARSAAAGRIPLDLAWRAILLASLANLLFKAALVAALGPRALRVAVAAAFAPPLLAGAALVWLWPAV